MKIKEMTRKAIIIFFVLIIGLTFVGCKKLIEIDGPTTSISSKNVYNNDATAIGSITSLYAGLTATALTQPGELTSLSCIAGLSADELYLKNSSGGTNLDTYFRNNLTSTSIGIDYWSNCFQKLFIINSAIESITSSEGLSPKVKTQLLGEAKFMRAFYYFYLVNLYGDVPIVLTSDYTVNSLIGRSPKSLVYKQIESDLIAAKDLLSDKYLKGDCVTEYPNGTEERVRPTRWAAIALLARSYLYMEDWEKAELEATFVISNTAQYHLLPLENVFLKNNQEALWQLQPVINGLNTQEADAFLPSTGGFTFNLVYLNEDLANAFQADDRRKSEWMSNITAGGIRYYYSSKYKVLSSSAPGAPIYEYSTVLRLAEQILIRAEARARKGNIEGAIADVDLIRGRAGMSLLKVIDPNINKEDLIVEILKEKQLELFTEWGHRWLDLKRTGNVDEVMKIVTPKKSNGEIWKSYQQNYPISLNELKANPRLVQTVGY